MVLEMSKFVFVFLAKSDPFSIQFVSDWIEAKLEAIGEVATNQAGSGFQLTYFMSSNNC